MSITDPGVLTGLEWLAVLFNLFFLYFLIRRRRVCWLWGIGASALSVALMIGHLLYSEALLYTFYIIMGVYGYLIWGNNEKAGETVAEWPLYKHLWSGFIGFTLGLGLGFYFDRNTRADYPYADAFSTSFSLVSTFLETHRIISGWLYWIVLNLFTAGLYWKKGMQWYALLMLVYAVFSWIGYRKWRLVYKEQKPGGIQAAPTR